MANKLTLPDVYQIIDKHIESSQQFLFVTDKDLAELICEYVFDNYDLYDENVELNDKYIDYYVSLYFDEDGCNFYCETARRNNGNYKWADAMEDSVNYFVCNGMTEKEANEYLKGDYCTWSWIEIVVEDDCEDNQEYIEDQLCDCCRYCDSENCDDYECTCGNGENDQCEDEEYEECNCPICQAEYEVKDLDCYCEECNSDYEKEALNECLERIFGNTCPDCIIESVLRLAYKFKEIGRQSVKQEIRGFLED